MFVIRCLYLISDDSHEDYLNKGNDVFVSALALNRLRMHNKRMRVPRRVYCPRMLVWCSLLLLVAITAINVHAVHANLLYRCLQTREIFKNTRQELQNARVRFTRMLQV